MREIIVIGGGASGMTAAIAAGRKGADVLLLEQKEQLGKKLLATGNGRCNFTNLHQEPICYRTENLPYAWQVLNQFSYQDTIRFFLELGIYSKNRNGYLYPYSDQASAVTDVLKMELKKLGVEVHLEESVREIRKTGEGFTVKTSRGTYETEKVILSAGSKAAPKTGSDGSGYTLAESLGHSLLHVFPALVQLRCKEKSYKNLAGIRTLAKVSLFWGETCMAEDTGELQLVDYGISGIPVFQVSRYASQGLLEKKKVMVYLDFMPDFSEEQCFTFFQNRIHNQPERTVEEFFVGLLHKKLAAMLIRISGVHDNWMVGELKQEQIWQLIRAVKGYRTEITGTNSFDQAQVCAGGVPLTELREGTLESRKAPGLFLTGELLDVDGICGGYNLQWAWSSGYLAGCAAAEKGKEPAV